MQNYKYNSENNSFSIVFDAYTLILEPASFVDILNLHKILICDDSCDYPYIHRNCKKVDILQLVFGLKRDNVHFVFHNNNKYDIRLSNVSIYHEKHFEMTKQYDVQEYVQGHVTVFGADAFILKNPIWITKNNEYV